MTTSTAPTCPWCLDTDPFGNADPADLCYAHNAEYCGMSVAEMERMEREQAYDLI